jgi:hypothetical protein
MTVLPRKKEFDASLEDTDDGKQSHVVAWAEMKRLSDESMRLVGMLDGFNRYRFHRDPELIVAWASAKHVLAAPQPKETDDHPHGIGREVGSIAEHVRRETQPLVHRWPFRFRYLTDAPNVRAVCRPPIGRSSDPAERRSSFARRAIVSSIFTAASWKKSS